MKMKNRHKKHYSCKFFYLFQSLYFCYVDDYYILFFYKYIYFIIVSYMKILMLNHL